MSPTRLRCTVCQVEIVLDENTAVMLAEVDAFSAAHSAHAEGIDMAAEITTEDDEQAG